MIKRFGNYVNDNNQEQEEMFSLPQKKDENPNKDMKNVQKKNNKKLKIKEEKQQEPIKYREFQFCKLCSQKLYSNQDFTSHISSKKHKKNLKKITFYELIKCHCSVRTFLRYKNLISPLKNSKIGKARNILYKRLLKKLFRKLPLH